MSDFVLYGETDDIYTDADGEFWYAGTGISTYNGGPGQDTLDFSASTADLLWYEPIGYNWVQDPSIPLGQPGPDGFVAEYGYAVLQSWEHIIAGSGQDTMYANGVEGLVLDAGEGNDLFLYAPGTLKPGQHFNGNLGDDILDFTGNVSVDRPFIFDMHNGTVTFDNFAGAAAPWVMTVEGVENVYGGFSDDTFIPGADSRVLNGDVGQDFFDISAGVFQADQTFIGDVGYDTLSVAGSSSAYLIDLSLGVIQEIDTGYISYLFTFEEIKGGNGNDTLIGSNPDLTETLNGGGGDDSIVGGDDGSLLLGKRGNDYILGGSGQDTISGHEGSDTLIGGEFGDKMTGHGGRDSLEGGNGADTLKGSGGKDTLIGDNGADKLKGGGGNDSLDGDKSTDTLVGGGGNDMLTGGDKDDKFVFEDGHGQDVILDFETAAEEEVIDLQDVSAIANLTDLLDAATDTIDGVLIATGGSSSILLIGVAKGDLSEDDFLFT